VRRRICEEHDNRRRVGVASGANGVTSGAQRFSCGFGRVAAAGGAHHGQLAGEHQTRPLLGPRAATKRSVWSRKEMSEHTVGSAGCSSHGAAPLGGGGASALEGAPFCGGAAWLLLMHALHCILRGGAGTAP
jgi:hypothetical protein